MKPILILMLVLAGCTTVSYESNTGQGAFEKYSMTTWFKSVEDVSVIRTPDLFGLTIGATSNDDGNVFEAVAKILEFYSLGGIGK